MKRGATKRYSRVLMKLSGELLRGNDGRPIDLDFAAGLAKNLGQAVSSGTQLGVVIGGGNIWRGGRGQGLEIGRSTSDYMGMLATLINSLALQAALESTGTGAIVMSALAMTSALCEPFVARRAKRQLEKGRVVIFAAGTGNPYFSTDTAAALRAVEIDAEAILKATNVDGVYSEDPRKNPKARLFESITFDEVIDLRLNVMDTTAFTICRENRMPIVVFNLERPDNLRKLLRGERLGTRVVL